MHNTNPLKHVHAQVQS